MPIMPISWLQKGMEAVSCIVERIEDHSFFDGTSFVRTAEGVDLPVLDLARVGTSAMFVGDFDMPPGVFRPGLYRITYLDTNGGHEPVGFKYWEILPDPASPVGHLESGRWHVFGGRWLYLSDRDPESVRQD